MADEQNFPEWVACGVDGGVDALAIGIKWRRRKKHPLVEVVVRCQQLHFGECLGALADGRSEWWRFDDMMVHKHESLFPSFLVRASARASCEFDVGFCSLT